ncbi:MAG TPA: response regulator [Candidatus Brocadiia bacterium]|nr:response regulator [Candidatus Brocadiia bacterium]
MQDKPLILVVDDDADFREAIQCLLEAGGYRVTCARNPQDALGALSATKPDLIVTDLMMDRLDAGFQLSRGLKQNNDFAEIPVIIVTAVGSQLGLDVSPRGDDDMAAMNVDAYMDKPVDPDRFLAKVRELLESRGREA